jgi:hypothetical protein
VESGRRNMLKKLMAAMAAGDHTAAFVLRHRFDAELKAAVRRAAVEVGRALPSDEVEAIATDFCTWLIPHAAAWRPDGALPWRWAWAHLTTEVRKNQGYWPLAAADPCDEMAAEQLVAVVDTDLLDTVTRLAADEPRVAALLTVLEATGTREDDIALLFDLAEQRHAGDPSPSHTVAPRYGLSPDAARKRAQRTRDRVRDFIVDHPEHADLAALPLLAKDQRAPRRRAA